MLLSNWQIILYTLVLDRSSFLQQSTSALLSLASIPRLPSPSDASTIATSSSAFTTETIASASSTKDDIEIALITKSFRDDVQAIVKNDPSLAGPLIRLAFHDATTWEVNKPFGGTGGPNGSIQYELDRSENRGIAKPLQLVQNMKSQSNSASSLSLADAIALAGAAAVEAIGGPPITIRMGRKDATEADPEFLRKSMRASTTRSIVRKTLPEAGLDSDGLRLYFGQLGFSEEEFVALCGCHGLGRHVSLLGMPKECLRNLTRTCLEEAPVLLPFVSKSVDTFDNSYFQFLLKWNNNDIKMGDVAFIPTDVDLVVDLGLKRYVDRFAQDQDLYFRVYSRAFQKLVDRTATTRERY